MQLHKTKLNLIDIDRWVQKRWFQIHYWTLFNSKHPYPNNNNFYLLEMFMYPSGKLHQGHLRFFSIGNAIALYQLIVHNKNVFWPIGFDSLGLPAENAAIKYNCLPWTWIIDNIHNMKQDIKRLNFLVSWPSLLSTHEDSFLKQDQWILIKMFQHNYIYIKKAEVNWCNTCNVVLANAECINLNCWRCNNTIVGKYIEQWFIWLDSLKEELFYDLRWLIYWDDRVLNAQKHWIGEKKYHLYRIKHFHCWFILKPNKSLEKFTFFVEKTLYNRHTNRRCYILIIKWCNFTLYFILPYYISKDITMYNLLQYIDQNIFILANSKWFKELIWWVIEFKIYDIDVKKDVMHLWNDSISSIIIDDQFLFKELKIYNTKLNDQHHLNTFLVSNKYVDFKLQDWCISREWWWGTPLPFAYCKSCKKHFVCPDSILPIPILSHTTQIVDGLWMDIFLPCTSCEKKSYVVYQTADTFINSSWYYYWFLNPWSSKIIPNEYQDWSKVNVYIGGIEHAVGHLLYLRIYNRLLYRFGLIKDQEPIKKLIIQGMVLSNSFFCKRCNEYKIAIKVKNDVCYDCKLKLVCKIEKISKSKLNQPSDYWKLSYLGYDSLKMFLLFSAPIYKDIYWSEDQIKGCYRFLNKVIIHAYWLASIFNDSLNMYDYIRRYNVILLLKSMIFIYYTLRYIRWNDKILNDLDDHLCTLIKLLMRKYSLINIILKLYSKDWLNIVVAWLMELFNASFKLYDLYKLILNSIKKVINIFIKIDKKWLYNLCIDLNMNWNVQHIIKFIYAHSYKINVFAIIYLWRMMFTSLHINLLLLLPVANNTSDVLYDVVFKRTLIEYINKNWYSVKDRCYLLFLSYLIPSKQFQYIQQYRNMLVHMIQKNNILIQAINLKGIVKDYAYDHDEQIIRLCIFILQLNLLDEYHLKNMYLCADVHNVTNDKVLINWYKDHYIHDKNIILLNIIDIDRWKTWMNDVDWKYIIMYDTIIKRYTLVKLIV